MQVGSLKQLLFLGGSAPAARCLGQHSGSGRACAAAGGSRRQLSWLAQRCCRRLEWLFSWWSKPAMWQSLVEG